MATDDDKSADSLNLGPAERAALEAEQLRKLEQMARDVQRRYDPSRLSRIEASAAGRAEKLDDQTRTHMEARLGARFHDVRVVRGAFADRVTKRHRADAITVGSTGLILLRDTPRTNMRTAEGKALLAHELTHVRQAQRGMHFAIDSNLSQGSSTEVEARKSEEHEHALHSGSAAAPDKAAQLEELRARAVERVLQLHEEKKEEDALLHGFDVG